MNKVVGVRSGGLGAPSSRLRGGEQPLAPLETVYRPPTPTSDLQSSSLLFMKSTLKYRHDWPWIKEVGNMGGQIFPHSRRADTELTMILQSLHIRRHFCFLPSFFDSSQDQNIIIPQTGISCDKNLLKNASLIVKHSLQKLLQINQSPISLFCGRARMRRAMHFFTGSQLRIILQ